MSSSLSKRLSQMSLKQAIGISKSQSKNEPNKAIFLHQTGDRIVRIQEIFGITQQSNDEEPEERIYTKKGMFATVNRNGTVIVWSFGGLPMRVMKCTTIVTGLVGVSGGIILINDNSNGQSFILLQSNESGIQIFKFIYSPYVNYLENSPIFNSEHHIGFCTITSNDNVIAFPIHQSSFGLLSFTRLAKNLLVDDVPMVQPQLKCDGSSLIMFIKLISKSNNDYLITGMEKGKVSVYTVKGSVVDGNAEFDEWKDDIILQECILEQPSGSSSDQSSSKETNPFSSEEDFMVPLCAEFRTDTSVVIIGTNSKLIFILKLDFDNHEIQFDGKRSLTQKGVNDMSLHPDGKLLALGGWDGIIRILIFPFLKQLTFIKFHQCSINSVFFLRNFDSESNNKHYLLVGADDGQISCWDIDEKLNLNQSNHPNEPELEINNEELFAQEPQHVKVTE